MAHMKTQKNNASVKELINTASRMKAAVKIASRS